MIRIYTNLMSAQLVCVIVVYIVPHLHNYPALGIRKGRFLKSLFITLVLTKLNR